MHLHEGLGYFKLQTLPFRISDVDGKPPNHNIFGSDSLFRLEKGGNICKIAGLLQWHFEKISMALTTNFSHFFIELMKMFLDYENQAKFRFLSKSFHLQLVCTTTDCTVAAHNV